MTGTGLSAKDYIIFDASVPNTCSRESFNPVKPEESLMRGCKLPNGKWERSFPLRTELRAIKVDQTVTVLVSWRCEKSRIGNLILNIGNDLITDSIPPSRSNEEKWVTYQKSFSGKEDSFIVTLKTDTPNGKFGPLRKYCRLTMKDPVVTLDISSGQANRIIRDLEKRLRDEQKIVSLYNDLLTLMPAYSFLQKVSEALSKTGESETLKKLSETWPTVKPKVMQLLVRATTTKDRQAVLALVLAMDSWIGNPSVLKLKDLISPDQLEIIRIAGKLASESNKQKYQVELRKHQTNANNIQTQLDLARRLLKDWL